MDEYEKGFRMTVDGMIILKKLFIFLLIVHIQYYYVLVSGVQHRHQNV